MGGKTYIDSRAQKREEIEFLDESNVRSFNIEGDDPELD